MSGAYRENVGVALFDDQGRVWLGRRSASAHEPNLSGGPWLWQMPQGGVDPGERPGAAAMRELAEETGVAQAELIGQAPDWTRYDFPPEVRDQPGAKGFCGQRQLWFAFRFLGEDDEFVLDGPDQEFDAWRWAELEETPDLVVPFKREVYAQVVRWFAPFVQRIRAGTL